jgi:hypothetical protein
VPQLKISQSLIISKRNLIKQLKRIKSGSQHPMCPIQPVHERSLHFSSPPYHSQIALSNCCIKCDVLQEIPRSIVPASSRLTRAPWTFCWSNDRCLLLLLLLHLHQVPPPPPYKHHLHGQMKRTVHVMTNLKYTSQDVVKHKRYHQVTLAGIFLSLLPGSFKYCGTCGTSLTQSNFKIAFEGDDAEYRYAPQVQI